MNKTSEEYEIVSYHNFLWFFCMILIKLFFLLYILFHKVTYIFALKITTDYIIVFFAHILLWTQFYWGIALPLGKIILILQQLSPGHSLNRFQTYHLPLNIICSFDHPYFLAKKNYPRRAPCLYSLTPALKISWGPPTANLWPDWSPQKRVNRDKLDQR